MKLADFFYSNPAHIHIRMTHTDFVCQNDRQTNRTESITFALTDVVTIFQRETLWTGDPPDMLMKI